MKIIFNEKEYGSLAEMPPEERAQYQHIVDALSSGEKTGEFSETRQTSAGPVHRSTKISREIVCNGTTYQDMDELPAEVRQLLGNQNKESTGPGTVQISSSIDHDVLPSETIRHTSYDGSTLIRTSPAKVGWACLISVGIIVLMAWLLAALT